MGDRFEYLGSLFLSVLVLTLIILLIFFIMFIIIMINVLILITAEKIFLLLFKISVAISKFFICFVRFLLEL